MSWSGGKDAAYALLGIEVDGLLVTYDEQTRSIPVHDVPLSAIEAQASAVGLPLVAVPLPAPCPNEVYVARVGAALAGVEFKHFAFAGAQARAGEKFERTFGEFLQPADGRTQDRAVKPGRQRGGKIFGFSGLAQGGEPFGE